jgi:hypothetical protein
MNINSVYGNVPTAPTTGVDAVTPSTATTSGASSGIGAAATATISTPGQLFGELQQLSQQDPSKFKAVAAQLATTFQSAASQASGPQAQFLTQLANQFTQASQTGTLQPPQSTQATAGVSGAAGVNGAAGGHHHHHHHHGGGGGGALAIGSNSSDVDQAYESALSVVTQATGGSSTSSSST